MRCVESDNACTCVCACVRVCVRAGNRQGVTHTYIGGDVCVCSLCTHACLSVCIARTCTYTNVRTYIPTYTYVHTYTYVTVNALSVCRCSVLESLTSDEVFSGNVTLRGAGG